MDELEKDNNLQIINKEENYCTDKVSVTMPSLVTIKCGLIFVSSDSSFYINCIVENCIENKSFFEINKFIEHVNCSHPQVGSGILSLTKGELLSSIKDISFSENTINTSSKNQEKKEGHNSIINCAEQNPLEIQLKNQIKAKKENNSQFIRHSRKSVEVTSFDDNINFKYNDTGKVILENQINHISIIDKRKNVKQAEEFDEEPFTYSISKTEKSNLKKNLEKNTSNIVQCFDEGRLNPNSTCHICNKTFQSRKNLSRHIVRHSQIKPHKIIPCPKCNKIFKYDHHLRFHMVVHKKEHKCPDCNKIFNNQSSLRRHMIIHLKEKPFKCIECNLNFSQKENLQLHIRKTHEENLFHCFECSDQNIDKTVLESHKSNSHVDFSKSELDKSIDKTIFKCDICSKIFKTNRILKIHMKSLHKEVDDPISCPKCRKSFKYEHHLKMHLVIHERIHKCTECDKIYANRPALLNHLQSHSGEKKFKCEFCETWCFTKIQLKRHIVYVHSEKKYECEHCGKKFNKKHVLTGHIRTHTKEKPLVCEVCGMTFFTPFLLNNHLKRHNNQRDFKCNFASCGKSFFTRVALVDHEVTHTKLKPFFCAVEGCNSRFTLRSGLVKHKKLHSNIKNYICKICGKAYAQSPGLYAHMKTHHHPLPII